jgi:hypothetical protein
MTTIERNTALAALTGPEGYEAAKECPQGHLVRNAVINQLCKKCYLEHVTHRPFRARRSDEVDDHPEWRIQSVPKDFSRPGVLEPLAVPLLEKWAEPDHTGYGWEVSYVHETWYSIEYYEARVAGGPTQGYGKGTTSEIALGEALLDAVGCGLEEKR